MKFQFTEAEKATIMQEIAITEEYIAAADPVCLDSNGQLSICQLFENNCLDLLLDVERAKLLPTELDQIDFDFTGRAFDIGDDHQLFKQPETWC